MKVENIGITIEDCLKLDSLKDAKVIAGGKGLKSIVNSISVLEYSVPDALESVYFRNNELVISGLISIKDDVSAQCEAIRRLSDLGEVGLILYYVGIFIPFVHEKLIKTADEIDFPLICMPVNCGILRYSDVICDVMAAIFKDDIRNGQFIGEMLDKISVLKQYEGSAELIESILNDEPIKMRRLAEILNVKVENIHTMWVLMNNNGFISNDESDIHKSKMFIETKKFLNEQNNLSITDIYENKIVSFTDNPAFDDAIMPIAEELHLTISKKNIDVTLVVCSYLKDTSEVRNAYLLICEHFKHAKIIFPLKKILTYNEVKFSEECYKIVLGGEESIKETLLPLMPLLSQEQDNDWITTLAIFFLDTKTSVAETAEILFLHKNTVKYRISKTNERLHYNILKMPEFYKMYIALAVWRLLKQFK